MSKQELVGYIGVDAGLCWVGDPCYILHKDKNAEHSWGQPPKTIGSSWSEFCDLLGNDVKVFNYDNGYEGLGIAVHTAYGDGTYPVYVNRNKEGLITKVTVKFA